MSTRSGSSGFKLYLPPAKLQGLDARARAKKMNRNEYVRWCLDNAGDASGLAQIVGDMTIEDLAKLTKVSVGDIVKWAMTPEPEPKPLLTVVKPVAKPVAKPETKAPVVQMKKQSKKTAKAKKSNPKEAAKQKDDKVLQDKLKE